MEDRKSWAIKEEEILDDLIALMNLTDEEKDALKTIKAKAEAVAPQMIDAFYNRLLNHENTQEYLDGHVDRLHKTLEMWFIELFSGDYTAEYVQNRLTIGKTHVRIGLPVRYPLAMMDLVMEFGQKIAAESDQPELTTSAFRKLASLDIAIFNQAYENTQLQHLSEMVGNERLARRLLSNEA